MQKYHKATKLVITKVKLLDNSTVFIMECPAGTEGTNASGKVQVCSPSRNSQSSSGVMKGEKCGKDAIIILVVQSKEAHFLIVIAY